MTNPGLHTSKKFKINFLQDYGALILLVVLIVINCMFTPNFTQWRTVWNLVIQSTTVMLLALGLTTVIATGGIDISVGSVMAVSSMVAATFIYQGHILIGCLAGLAVAVLSGLVVGSVVMRFNVQPMITTVAMMYILRGIAKLFNNGGVMNYRNRGFSNFAYIRLWDTVPIQLVILIGAAIVMYLLLRKSRFGFFVEAYGNNPKAARTAGIDTIKVVVSCYVVCSFLAGCSGLLEAALVSGVDPANMGLTKEMDAIAATAMGGTMMSGGRPNVGGTVCGVLALQLITMMVNMNNVPYSYSLILKTIIIILAVYSQNFSKDKS